MNPTICITTASTLRAEVRQPRDSHRQPVPNRPQERSQRVEIACLPPATALIIPVVEPLSAIETP